MVVRTWPSRGASTLFVRVLKALGRDLAEFPGREDLDRHCGEWRELLTAVVFYRLNTTCFIFFSSFVPPRDRLSRGVFFGGARVRALNLGHPREPSSCQSSVPVCGGGAVRQGSCVDSHSRCERKSGACARISASTACPGSLVCRAIEKRLGEW